MVHGNWKELFQAAGEGNVALMRYHLRMGEDAHFQHPEYMSAPLFEAIRHNQSQAVETLIQHDATLLSQVEDYSGLSPLAYAMEEGQHSMVDLLKSMDDLPIEQQKLLKTIALVVSKKDTTYVKQIMEQVAQTLLQRGHCVIFFDNTNDPIGMTCPIHRLMETTRNHKVYSRSVNDRNHHLNIHSMVQTLESFEDETTQNSLYGIATADPILLHTTQSDVSLPIMPAHNITIPPSSWWSGFWSFTPGTNSSAAVETIVNLALTVDRAPKE